MAAAPGQQWTGASLFGAGWWDPAVNQLRERHSSFFFFFLNNFACWIFATCGSCSLLGLFSRCGVQASRTWTSVVCGIFPDQGRTLLPVSVDSLPLSHQGSLRELSSQELLKRRRWIFIWDGALLFLCPSPSFSVQDRMPGLLGTYHAKSGKVLVYPSPPLTSLHFPFFLFKETRFLITYFCLFFF